MTYCAINWQDANPNYHTCMLEREHDGQHECVCGSKD